MVEELATNINERKKPVVLQAYRCPPVANSKGEIVSSISLWDIVNQFIKHDFPAVLTFIVGRKNIT